MQQSRSITSSIRYFTAAILVVALFSIIVFRLLNLQVRSGEELLMKAEESKMKQISLTGSRGKITDRNGLELAYDTSSYDLEFAYDSSLRYENGDKVTKAAYSRIILETIQIVEKNNGVVIDNLSIVRDENGELAFDWRTSNEEAAQARRTMWLRNFYFTRKGDEDISAADAYERLLEEYTLQDLDWEDARKVLAIWEEWQFRAYLGKPIRIARDINWTTVAQVSARQNELIGMSIRESTTRVYPRGETAAHTIGYLGAISAEKKDEYVGGKKYAPDDLVGVSGIELYMEEDLTGNSSIRQGVRTVEVNSSGHVTRELSYEPPSNGNNVVLTIDLPMQIILDQALKAGIESTAAEQRARIVDATDLKTALYLNTLLNRGTTELNLAKAGAAVVMEVNTGNVLAMSSFPGFDPNDFIGGLSTAAYQKYYDTEKSELARLSPTLNRAIRTKATPGSIFKMVTGLAGVMEGVVTVNTAIDDQEEFDKYDSSGRAPRCWVWPNWHQHHGMTLSTGIKNSCNYYFYTVADGLGIEKLHEWAGRLGLTSATGIELSGEVASVVGNQQVLYDINRTPGEQTVARTRQAVNAVRTQLVNLRTRLERSYTDERIEDVLDQLMRLSVEQSADLSSSIRDILMTELGLSYQEVGTVIGAIYSQIRDLRWTPTETIMTGIGQSITEVTPIGAARYLSAIANGGTVYDAKLIDRVIAPDGSLVRVVEPVSAPPLEGVEEALDAIREGMRGVVDEGGTAHKYFVNYPYTNQMAAKTGTAQVNLVDVENNAWFVAYAPFEKPEIAVVVFIANGMSGGYGSPVAQAAISYYFESQQIEHSDPEPVVRQWIP